MKHLCNLLIILSFIVTLFNPTIIYAETEIKSISTEVRGGIDKSHKSERYLNARVKFNNMMIDGQLFGSPSIRFKISQIPGRKISYALILSSGNSLLNINKNNNKNGGYGNSGYKYWIRSEQNMTLGSVLNDFSPRQVKALKSMCGFLSNPDNIKKNIINVIETKSRSMDSSVKRLFTARANAEISKILSTCKRVTNRKINGYETISILQTPKICGKKTSGLTLNTKTYKAIQKNLKVLGYYSSDIDGVFGAGSCSAFNNYNSSKNRHALSIFTKFSYDLLQEEADTILLNLEEKKKVSALEAEKKEAAILETSKKEIAKKEAAILEAAKKEEAVILEAAKKEAAEIVEAAKKEIAILDAAEKKAAEIVEAAKKEAAILEAAKKEAAEIVEAAKKEATKLEDTKKEVSEIVETAKEEANATNELSASNILLADNITDEGSKSLNTSNTEEKELKENIFQIEKLSELQEIALKADTFLMEYNKDQAGKLMRYKLRLTVKGSEIDTSLVSKSIFGFENSSSIDISMSIGSSQAALDFIIDEENTKINLHFSDDASVNKDFASNIPELILDASEISGAFLVRIIDDGSNNIQSGDFAQILERLDSKDVALVGAFCSVIQSISVDKNTFIKSVTQNIPDESKDGFSTSPLVSDGVINIINSHATACVGELEKVNNTKASFDIPNLFDFEETGEALLENSTENILEKSRAELKAKEQKNAEGTHLEEEHLAEEKRLAQKIKREKEERLAEEKRLAQKIKREKEDRLAEEKRLKNKFKFGDLSYFIVNGQKQDFMDIIYEDPYDLDGKKFSYTGYISYVSERPRDTVWGYHFDTYVDQGGEYLESINLVQPGETIPLLAVANEFKLNPDQAKKERKSVFKFLKQSEGRKAIVKITGIMKNFSNNGNLYLELDTYKIIEFIKK